MSVRKSTIFLTYLVTTTGVLVLIFAHAALERRDSSRLIRERASMVERYELTDLCIFTDARYTRNPAMADLGTPFQDHPLSLEHFPSGSIIAPPAIVGGSRDSIPENPPWAREKSLRDRANKGESR